MNLISTTRPDRGEWMMAFPTPSHIITWPGYRTRSPAWAVSNVRGSAARIWSVELRGNWYPAIDHAKVVSPEQSNPTPGSEALRLYGTPN